MPGHNPIPTERRRHRHKPLVGAVLAVVACWSTLTAVPVPARAQTPQAGDLQTEIIRLTDDDGDPTALRAASDATTSGWSTSVDVDPGTQSVAVSWLGNPDGTVEVRGRSAAGWTDWSVLESDPDEAPDDAERSAAGLVWFGATGVDEVQVKVAAGELVDLELQTMRYEGSGATAVGDPAAATAEATTSAAPLPTIQPRSSYTSRGWASSNPGCGSTPTVASSGVRYAVIHHTVNSNTYAAGDVPAMLAAINAYHTGTNRWCDTGYNFIIDRFGRIWEGRSGGIARAIVGGHAAGFNTGSVGIAFLGQHEPGVTPAAVAPTSQALDAAGRLIGWKLGLEGIDPSGTVRVTSGGSNRWPAGSVVDIPRVIGHRDVGFSACPGQHLYDRLSTIRQIARTSQGTVTPPPTNAYTPFNSASQLVTQQYRDILRRSPSAQDLTYWTARVGSTWTAGQFIAHLLATTEADNRVHAVTRLYQAYFLRNPDHGGFTFWMNRRGEGQTLVSISNAFARSSEFRNRYGTLTNTAFVDRVYRNVLGRPADSGGLAYWRARLDAGTTRGQVMANFSQSNEYIAATRAGTHVVGVYQSMLLRAVPNDLYIWFTAGLNNAGTTLSSMASFVYEGDDYHARIG